MAKKTKGEIDASTEEKIKEAARKVFTKKGFAATRTRDIAEEANINLALLNYYFRSKEKLFDIVMMENIQQFLMAMKGVLNDKNSSILEKVTTFSENYITLLKEHADLPLFILSEIRANPEKLAANMGAKDILLNSNLYMQIQEATKHTINPIHFIINMLGLAVFPFIAGPLFQAIGGLKQNDYGKLMEERKKMIPIWIEAMLKV